jgi:alkanesulfonate monooxygenase SsuD/methylene tetrahydromethanopterin reductase-like flavin-dependent oxidoreductase (luciferase family)
MPVLTAAATVTSRIRLGTLVTSPNFRHPVALAREVLALDDISGGRFNLGIGAGGPGWDANIMGGTPWSPVERSARFAEFVELTDRLLTQREVTYSGRFYTANEARSYPGCRQQPRIPFFVAGTGPKAMAVVARFGQTWVTTGPRGLPDQLRASEGARAVATQLEVLKHACEAMGREPSELGRLVLSGAGLDPGLSSVEEFADTLGRYAEVGVTDYVVHWPRRDEPYQGDRAHFEKMIAGQLA